MHLPPLREELQIVEGPRAHDGQPGWTLHDPSRNRFFRLDWTTFEILKRWALGDPELLARQVAEQTTLRPALEDVLAVADFARSNQLLHTAGADTSGAFAELHRRARPSWWLWLVHHYLFIRVPLINPDALLRRLLPVFGFLFRPMFWWTTAAALSAGLVLLARNWSAFRADWTDFADLRGLLSVGAVLVFVKIVHEFAHGIAAARHGCRVPAMGVAFLVMAPVAYTDTNDAWRLSRRAPRLWIGAAGILSELVLASWATLAWGLLPAGPLRSAACLLASVTWVKSLLVNLSPIMRFDGYYLLSDALDLPNLHARCFALARWRLREALFGLGEPPPEHFAPRLRRGLVALALAIWLYRLVVFFGIALYVYHFFFKALGIVLFAVEIGWFIVLPIWSEMKVWFAKRSALLASRRARLVCVALGALVLLAAVPLPRRVRLAAELSPGRAFAVIPPEAARVESAAPAHLAAVRAGAPLVRMESPELRQRHAVAFLRLSNLRLGLAAALAEPELRPRLPVLRAQIDTAEAAVRETEAALARLAPSAPFAGVFHLADPDLRVGEWVARDETLGVLVGDAPWRAVAYVPEQEAHLLRAGSPARFYHDGRREKTIALRVVSIETDASRVLEHPGLAADAGGDVPVKLSGNDLVPAQAVYRVILEADAMPASARVQRGRLVIRGDSESLLARASRHGLGVLWKELGF